MSQFQEQSTTLNIGFSINSDCMFIFVDMFSLVVEFNQSQCLDIDDLARDWCHRSSHR